MFKMNVVYIHIQSMFTITIFNTVRKFAIKRICSKYQGLNNAPTRPGVDKVKPKGWFK